MNNRSKSRVLHVMFLVLQHVTRIQSPTLLVPPLLSTCSESQGAYHLIVQSVKRTMNHLSPMLGFLLELCHWLVLVYHALLLLCSRITSQAVKKPYPSNQCNLVHVELLLTVLNVVCHICPLLKLCSVSCCFVLVTFCVRKIMHYCQCRCACAIILPEAIKLLPEVTLCRRNLKWRVQRKRETPHQLTLPLSWESHDLTR